MLKAPPQHFRSRPIPAAATHKPAELRDPLHRLTQRWGLQWRLGDAMDGAIERLPLLWLQQHTTGDFGHGAGPGIVA